MKISKVDNHTKLVVNKKDLLKQVPILMDCLKCNIRPNSMNFKRITIQNGNLIFMI